MTQPIPDDELSDEDREDAEYAAFFTVPTDEPDAEYEAFFPTTTETQ